MEEDKKMICEKLGELLKLTRAGEDIDRIEYSPEKDDAVVFYKSCSTSGLTYGIRVCVEADSGIAMIQDIIRKVV